MRASQINKDFTKERMQGACMIANYVGSISKGSVDSVAAMQECIDYANNHDFELEEVDGEWLISSEKYRDDAIKFAKKIIKKYDEGI